VHARDGNAGKEGVGEGEKGGKKVRRADKIISYHG
jgi:hypothetical protein